MTTPLELTFQTLTKSRNKAAGEVLLAAWRRGLVDQALQALVTRRSKAEHLEILENWQDFTPAQQQIVLESSSKLAAALRDALGSDNAQLFETACTLVVRSREYDLIPTLLTLAEQTDHPHSDQATELVFTLVVELSEFLLQNHTEALHRDPEAQRRVVLESLERSLSRFRSHNRGELVEAYVFLAGPHNEKLFEILNDPYHPCFRSVNQALTKSDHPAILATLLGMLHLESTPGAILTAVSHRSDRPFLLQLLHEFSAKPTPELQRNLKRIRSFHWLNSPPQRLSLFAEHQQVGLTTLLLATRLPQADLQIALEELLIAGKPAGRAAACTALADMSGSHINSLILQASQDESPLVQAAAARQLRHRHIPGTMPLLLRLLDSPHEEVCQAAREGLTEFKFDNFVQTFDSLSEEARLTTGNLVQRVDLDFPQKLAEEFTAHTVKRRLRAVEIAGQFGVLPRFTEQLLEMAADEDHVIRAAAAEALQFCPGGEVHEMLRQLTEDRSGTVQNIARDSLASLDNSLRV